MLKVKRNKTILLFFLKFVLCYGALIFVYPLIDNSFRNIIISEGNYFLGKMDGSNAVFNFSEFRGNEKEVKIIMQNLAKKRTDINAIQFKFDNLYTTYLPFILLVSLIFASPVTWKRKIAAFIGGILIFNLFVIFKIIILIYFECNTHPEVDLLILTPGKLDAVNFICSKFVEPLPPSFIFVVLIWILLVFKKADFSNKIFEETKNKLEKKNLKFVYKK